MSTILAFPEQAKAYLFGGHHNVWHNLWQKAYKTPSRALDSLKKGAFTPIYIAHWFQINTGKKKFGKITITFGK